MSGTMDPYQQHLRPNHFHDRSMRRDPDITMSTDDAAFNAYVDMDSEVVDHDHESGMFSGSDPSMSMQQGSTFSAINSGMMANKFGYSPQAHAVAPTTHEPSPLKMAQQSTLVNPTVTWGQPYAMPPSPASMSNGSPVAHYPAREQSNSPLHHLLAQTSSIRQNGQITPPDGAGDISPTDLTNPALTTQTTGRGSVSKGKRRSRADSKRLSVAGDEVGLPSSPQTKRKGSKAAASTAVSNQEMEDPQNPEEEGKREKFLERNRIAASKCRQKKKEWTNNLEERARNLNLQKMQKMHEIHQLRDEMLLLKSELLKHQDCGCTRIQNYIKIQAETVMPNSNYLLYAGMGNDGHPQHGMMHERHASVSSYSNAPVAGGSAGHSRHNSIVMESPPMSAATDADLSQMFDSSLSQQRFASYDLQ